MTEAEAVAFVEAKRRARALSPPRNNASALIFELARAPSHT
jgi:hypothetical protein